MGFLVNTTGTKYIWHTHTHTLQLIHYCNNTIVAVMLTYPILWIWPRVLINYTPHVIFSNASLSHAWSILDIALEKCLGNHHLLHHLLMTCDHLNWSYNPFMSMLKRIPLWGLGRTSMLAETTRTSLGVLQTSPSLQWSGGMPHYLTPQQFPKPHTSSGATV